uniref:Sugar phosphate transporter domain-containing protein n=1 Tax=Panagrolaimus superbus TaxID=310955 RepID=A0A914YJM9_9BILA
MVLCYYPLSIGLTFYQKWFIKNYRYPLFIVTGHYITKFLIAYGVRFIYEVIHGTRRVRIKFREQLNWLMPIGICASLDIGLSNWALEYVTVSLYTMAKSSSILFIVAFSLLIGLERWRTSLLFSATLIASGLFLFTWRSTQLDYLGLLLVELAALCTGVRWTVSQFIMQKDDSPTPLRHPLDMVAHVQPWMCFTILPMVYIFEGHELNATSITIFGGEPEPFFIFTGICFGGFLAFLMEISVYFVFQEVMTLLLAHYLHGDRLTHVNLMGLLLCLIGMSLHGASKHSKKTSLGLPTRPSLSPSLPSQTSGFSFDDRKKLLDDNV